MAKEAAVASAPAPVAQSTPAPAAPSSSQPIPEAFEVNSPEATPQSDLEKSYDVTDPSELQEKLEATLEKDPVEPEVKADEGAPSDIDPDLMARAQQFDLTQDEIAALGSNEALKKIVERFEKHSKPPAAVEQAPAAKVEAVVAPEFKIDLDPKEYDQKVIDTFNGMNAHYAQKIAAMEKGFNERLTQATQFAEAHQAEQSTMLVDAAFAEIKEIAPFIGTKPMKDLAQDSAEAKTRMAIVEQARIMGHGYAAAKKEVDTKTLLTQAARVVLGDKMKTIATNDVRSAVGARRAQFLPRATNVRGGNDARTPEERARAAATEFMSKHNQD